MKRPLGVSLGVALVAAFAVLVHAQQKAYTAKPVVGRAQPLVLTETIPRRESRGCR
jgi:hypothetical protein